MAYGFKTGGRKPGVRNNKTLALEAAMERALAENPDLEPLDLMLAVVRDESAPVAARLEAAKVAAPYRHARLNAIEHKGNTGVTITMNKDDAGLL